MISKNELNAANSIIEEIGIIKEILRGFDSPHIETTIGLIDINSATRHEAKYCNEATWFHNNFRDYEKRLKLQTVIFLNDKIQSLETELSEYISS